MITVVKLVRIGIKRWEIEITGIEAPLLAGGSTPIGSPQPRAMLGPAHWRLQRYRYCHLISPLFLFSLRRFIITTTVATVIAVLMNSIVTAIIAVIFFIDVDIYISLIPFLQPEQMASERMLLEQALSLRKQMLVDKIVNDGRRMKWDW